MAKMNKKNIYTIYEKNRIITNIIDAMLTRDHFLILGHKNPDEDCIASMVAFALLLSKFYKDVRICLGENIHEHFQYLLNICKYNSIQLLSICNNIEEPIDTIVVCDTPKPSMIESNDFINPVSRSKDVLIIEVDHHIGADSEYIGDEGYCLVNEASSACELIGHLALKLNYRKEILSQYQIVDLFSRNLVLAILTGIIGDSGLGQFLKSRREKRYYRIFSTLFNNLLTRETVKETNFSNMEQLFLELQRHSSEEERCYNYIMNKKRFSPSIGYVTMNQKDMDFLYEEFDEDTIITVSRAVADKLAEESKKLSLVVYYDNPESSNLIQFRVRRSHFYKKYDLRDILSLFSIENGGGHEGAIGFRIPKNQIKNLGLYVGHLIEGIEKAIATDTVPSN